MPAPRNDYAREVYEKERRHVLAPWSAWGKTDPMVVNEAEGCHMIDGDGNRLLDFTSQLVNTNIGHQHPKVVEAIKEQADKLCTINPAHANDARAEAARLISEVAPEGMNRVFFTNAGTEAVEHAIRMARRHTGRHKTLSAFRSYHGATTTSMNLTGDTRRWANDMGNTGAVHFYAPYLYRSPFYATDEKEECDRALEHLDSLIALEGPDHFAALILESIPGTVGIMVPPKDYLRGVREICDKYGIVMICDEVMSGFGRTGEWLALDHFRSGDDDWAPDLITFAKGSNSGYLPLGGVILHDRIAASFENTPYTGGLTYAGHPLACASAVATINVMRDEGIVDNARMIGEDVIGPRLREMAERHPSIGEVRGTGVFWAVELVADRETREPLAPYGGSSEAMAKTFAEAKRNGVVMFMNYNRFHVVPPCIITPELAREGLDVFDAALDVADSYTSSAG